ncbi:AAA family ATPase [Thauera aromatica]|nr:AAA family ATPase [Thauera aromatica]MCK2127242.1 AAA family ATPase [Thauera aromatica]
MRLSKVTLSNFRCFPSLELKLDPALTILVAENGQGKSSVLDAVRIVLWPFVSSFDLARNAFSDPGNAITVDDVRLIKGNQKDMLRQLPCEISATGDFGIGAERSWSRYRDSEAKRSKTKDAGDTSFMRQWAGAVQQQIRDPNKPAIDLPVFGYYGTGRLWAQKKLTEASKGADDTQSSDFYIRTFAYLNCLDPASSYKHFQEWFTLISNVFWETTLKWLVDGKATEADAEKAEIPLHVVREAVDCLLRSVTGWHSLEYSHTHEKSLVLHHDQQGVLKVDQLSDGIRSVLAMIGDIAYRCYKLNPHLGRDAARQTQGVVLIDEIDMHLHPLWQQCVLGQLREAFPSVQFIVTTHSPQVLTTVSRDNIRILQAAETGFEARKPDFSPLAHESGDALAKVMGTQREPELPLQDDIRRYEQLVRTGQEGSPDAQQLRDTLEKAGYQFHESDLATWRFLAARKFGKAG